MLIQLVLHAEHVRKDPLLNDLAVTQFEDADFRDLYAVSRRWIAEELPQVGPA